jgi:hypothetical protein
MSRAKRSFKRWFATGAASLLLVPHALLFADDSAVTHTTPSEIREGYVGTSFSRLPDLAYSTWLVDSDPHGHQYGVSHVTDRGIEMLWLETVQLPSTNNQHGLFSVVDVLVLPKNYAADGLVLTMCYGGGGTTKPAVAALTNSKTGDARRAWAVDVATGQFCELSPAAGTCTLLAPGDD